MGQYGFNLKWADEFSDGEAFRVASHQQSGGPMGIETAIVEALYASNGVRKTAVHHEVIVHVVVARGQARGEDHAVNEFQKTRVGEDFRADFLIRSKNPGSN